MDQAAARRGAPQVVSLLDADPDLGSELTAEELAAARRQVIVPAIAFASGPWRVSDLTDAPGVTGDVHGFLVLEGAVTIDLSIARFTSTRLITPFELVLLDGWDDDSIPLRWGATVLEPALLAVFDARLRTIAQRWPALVTTILQRGAQQLRHAQLQQGISQLPRVEDRLLALMWSIADRRGVARTDGVWVHLPVTHETLAQMIGARRPTVSLGLRALRESGLMRPDGNGWLLDRASLQAFPTATGGDVPDPIDELELE